MGFNSAFKGLKTVALKLYITLDPIPAADGSIRKPFNEPTQVFISAPKG
jgi:hypothetical protein